MTHLIDNKYNGYFGFLKGLLFGFKSVCGEKKKGEGLWDITRADCPKCLKASQS